MKFADPKNDLAFKKIFGNEQHKSILISFILQKLMSNNFLKVETMNQETLKQDLDDYKKLLEQ